MIKSISNGIGLCTLIFISINLASCSKSSPGTPPVTDVCAGKTIVVTPTATATATCGADGKIDVAATGSTGFVYKLGSTGTYGSSASFTDLAGGDYTVFVKDAAGCEKTATVTVPSTGAAGAKFAAVKTLIGGKCQSCHNNTVANGGMNWAVDCNIVKFSARINARAVVDGTMPPTGPLTQTEKDVITTWINAGAGYGN
ncbi:hypothetical protein BH11BAC5_BH11BAC5_52290 [soil metagenome]|jgi:hypothetical protein